MTTERPTRVRDPRLTRSDAPPAPHGAAAMAAAAPAPPLRHLRVRQTYFSAEAAEELSIGAGAFNGNLSANQKEFALLYEALLESDATPRTSPDDPKAKWESVHALGVVLEISVRSLDAKLKLDVFTVAAAVQLGLAEAHFKTTVLPSTVPALADVVLPGGDLTMDSYTQLMDGIAAVKNALGDPALVPEPYLRPARIDDPQDDLQLSRTLAFAVRQIAKSKYLETALEDAGDRKLDPTLVELVYRALWPDVRVDLAPPEEVVAEAKSWLAEV
jgi:hypothetical protein